MVQKRFLMLTFSPYYKQWHRLIAFVGINAVLLRGSLAHGCNTKGQAKAWAISAELWQHRSIHVQGCGRIVWALHCRSQTCRWPTTMQGNKKLFTIQGGPMTLCTLKEFVLWIEFVGFLARPSGFTDFTTLHLVPLSPNSAFPRIFHFYCFRKF